MVHINYEDFCKGSGCSRYNLIERLKSAPESPPTAIELELAKNRCIGKCEKTAYQLNLWLTKQGISPFGENPRDLKKKWASQIDSKSYPFAPDIAFCQKLEEQGYGLYPNGSKKTKDSITVIFPDSDFSSLTELESFFQNNRYNPRDPDHVKRYNASRYARTYAMI
jgi:hypothetical protein